MKDLMKYFEDRLREGATPNDLMSELVKTCAEAQCNVDEELAKKRAEEEARKKAEEEAKAKEAKRLELGATLLNAVADYTMLVNPEVAKELIDDADTPLVEKLRLIDSAIESAATMSRLAKKIKDVEVSPSSRSLSEMLDLIFG